MTEYQKVEFSDLEPGDEVLIGTTWVETYSDGGSLLRLCAAPPIRTCTIMVDALVSLGVECRRKVKREPLSGVVRVDEALGSHSIARLPAEVHGKTIKWEVVE